MSETQGTEASPDIACPHCKKPFTADLMQGAAARFQGFKCPHCRLFIPLERVKQLASN